MVKGKIISERIEVFISYSHNDETLRKELEKHLSILKRQKLISTWHDRNIGAGEEWKGQIDKHLDSAQMILLLVSADFLASDYCYDIELKRAIERHKAGEARVIPIILRPVEWKGALFNELHALPTDAKPITCWGSLDEAFLDVTKGLKKVIEDMVKDAPSTVISIYPDPQVNNNSMILVNLYRLWSFAPKKIKNIILFYLFGLWMTFLYSLKNPNDIVSLKGHDLLAFFLLMLFSLGLLIAAVSYHKKIKRGIILGLTYPFSFSIFYLLFRYNRPDEVHCILWLFSVALFSTILYLQIRKDILHLEDEISLAHKP